MKKKKVNNYFKIQNRISIKKKKVNNYFKIQNRISIKKKEADDYFKIQNRININKMFSISNKFIKLKKINLTFNLKKFRNARSFKNMKILNFKEIEDLSISIFFIKKYYVMLCKKIYNIKKLKFNIRSDNFKTFYKNIIFLKNVLYDKVCELLQIKYGFLKSFFLKFVDNYKHIKPFLYKKELREEKKVIFIFKKKRRKRSPKFFFRRKKFRLNDKLYGRYFWGRYPFNIISYNIKRHKIKKYIFQKRINFIQFSHKLPRKSNNLEFNVLFNFHNKRRKYRYYSIKKKKLRKFKKRFLKKKRRFKIRKSKYEKKREMEHNIKRENIDTYLFKRKYLEKKFKFRNKNYKNIRVKFTNKYNLPKFFAVKYFKKKIINKNKNVGLNLQKFNKNSFLSLRKLSNRVNDLNTRKRFTSVLKRDFFNYRRYLRLKKSRIKYLRFRAFVSKYKIYSKKRALKKKKF